MSAELLDLQFVKPVFLVFFLNLKVQSIELVLKSLNMAFLLLDLLLELLLLVELVLLGFF